MNPALRAVLLAPPFSPLRLFRFGEQGWWFDNSDLSTMFQDSAGTTPVTAVGQPVGKQLDKSGRGNHRVQATDASRPVLQRTAGGLYYLEYDGVDASLATASAVDFTGTDKATIFIGALPADTTTAGVLTELSASSSTNAGSFGVFCNLDAGGSVAANTWQLKIFQASSHVLTKAVAGSVVVSGAFDFAGSGATEMAGRINGVVGGFTEAGTNAGAGAFGNFTAYFGRRNSASLPFKGREYSSICVGRTATEIETTRVERWINSRTAAY